VSNIAASSMLPYVPAGMLKDFCGLSSCVPFAQYVTAQPWNLYMGSYASAMGMSVELVTYVFGFVSGLMPPMPIVYVMLYVCCSPHAMDRNGEVRSSVVSSIAVRVRYACLRKFFVFVFKMFFVFFMFFIHILSYILPTR